MAKETATVVSEKSVKQYAIVAKPDMNSLVEEVNFLLERGWQPLGGVSVLQNGTTTYHFQAIARYA
jgi:hypothetical protein